MPNLCDSLIASAIGVGCDSIITRGLESEGLIINRKDIDFSSTVFDGNNNNVITTLVLRTGRIGYAVSQLGATPYTGTTVSMAKGTYVNKFNNTVALVVLDNGPEVSKNIIDGLANGEFVVILRNKHKGTNGNSEFQVFGYYQGLYAESVENDKYSEDVEGGWAVTLVETGAPKSALFFFNEDTETTEAAFVSLYTPATTEDPEESEGAE